MSKQNYPSLYFDNLARTASMLEGIMNAIDEDPNAISDAEFMDMAIEKKDSIDERAATIRSLRKCELELAERKKELDTKLKQLKLIQTKLKEKTLETMATFQNQPFRGDFCQLQANKTRGRVELELTTTKVSLSNAIDTHAYANTDIPSSCLGKVTYYYVNKDALYQELKAGLVIEDAKLMENRTLKIKDL